MFDLFGLGKQQDPQEATYTPAPVLAPEAAPETPRGSHKLWAFLLVLDSVFVIIFAGAVAAKVYQYWKAPVLAPAPAARRRAAPAPAAAPAPVAVAEPAKMLEPPKPAVVEAKPAADAPRPAKPSMLSGAPPADGKVKALRTEFKLLAPKAKSVELVGAFIVRGGRKDMTRSDDGTWTVNLYLNPGTYRYFFSVDKKKQLDPANPLSDKSASLLTLP